MTAAAAIGEIRDKSNVVGKTGVDLKDLEELLQECYNSDEIETSMKKLVECLESNISNYIELLLASDNNQQVKLITSDLIKIPDRIANIAAAFKVAVPYQLAPQPFCDSLLLAVGYAVEKCSAGLQPEMLGYFISKMLSNFKPVCSQSLIKFLRYLSALNEETHCLTAKLNETFTILDNKTLETCLLSSLVCLNSYQIHSLFGNALADTSKFKIVENLIFLRGSLTEEEMCELLGYLSLIKGDHVMRILRRAFLLVADKVFIEFSKYSDQVPICKCICICLALLSDSEIKQAKMHFTPILMKGAMYWMDLTVEKRTLGMCLLLSTLKKFGEENLPEWQIDDQDLLNTMDKLTNFKPCEKIEKESSIKLLENWKNINDTKTPNIPKKSEKKEAVIPPTAKIDNGVHQGPLMKDTPEEEMLDSDDDEFPAFDMSNDTKVEQNKTKKILYLRQVVEELGNPESDYIEDCFGLLPDLCRRHLKHEDPELVPALTKGILYSQNKFDSKDWMLLREQAAISILCTQPVPAAKSLFPAFYDRNFPMDTRFGILTWLVKAGDDIQNIYSGRPEFSDYIKTCVRGLCGGAGWAKLEFTGLESHYVSQLLISIGSLLKTGKNLLFWPELACDYLDLVLYTARSGRAVIQTTCVHSISLVLSLTEAHMVHTMEDVLARVSQWLGQTQGDSLGEEGANALMMMVMLQQEYNKLVINQHLNPNTTISFKTPDFEKSK